MAVKNRSSLRAKARMQAFGELPPDEPLTTDLPVFKARPPKKVSDLAPDWRETMIRLACQGKGTTAFMNHLKIHPTAVESLLRDEPEFRQHYQWCLALQKEWLENAGTEMIKGANGNHKVWAMFMVNVGNWKNENSRQEIVGDAQNPLVIKKQILDAATEEELKAYANEC